ncbi:hypothetical protein [Pontimicrobium sp. MEBiC01747]
MFSEIQLKIQNAKELDFGVIFNQSIELFKKIWVQGLVTELLKYVLMIPLMFVLYIPLILFGIIGGEMMDPQSIEEGLQAEGIAFIVFFYIMMLVIMFFAVIIVFGMQASFYRMSKAKDYNEVTGDDYFYFFKKPYLSKTIKIGAAGAGIYVLAMLLCVLPVFYVMVPVALISVIYAFNPELTVSNIIKLAFDLGNKKWLITFGLIIVSSLLAQIVGMFMCFVGVYVTISFAYLPQYFIYKEVVGFDDKDDILKIGNE